MLAQFRVKKNFTQKDMAEMLNTTLSFYAKIEIGVRNPSYNFLVKFKEAFPSECIDEIFFNNTNHEAWFILIIRYKLIKINWE